MKIVVACGGTGGHAFPGLAVAEELKRRGHEVTVWDSGRDIESSVMRNWHGATFSTGARQLSIRHVLSILASILRCRREMRKESPDVVLAMGSYSSLPPVLAARGRRIPVVLHEANSIPGRAVEFLSRFAKKVAISFDVTAKHLPGCETVRTGLPVRADISSGKRFEFIPADAFVVFVTGGSQGAQQINISVRKILPEMLQFTSVGLVAGRTQYESMVDLKKYEIYEKAKLKSNFRMWAFNSAMFELLGAADVIISRAGATTIAEMAVLSKAVILVPYAALPGAHQVKNAERLAKLSAAEVIADEEMVKNPEKLLEIVRKLVRSPRVRADLAKNLHDTSATDAAERLAKILIEVAEPTEKK